MGMTRGSEWVSETEWKYCTVRMSSFIGVSALNCTFHFTIRSRDFCANNVALQSNSTRNSSKIHSRSTFKLLCAHGNDLLLGTHDEHSLHQLRKYLRTRQFRSRVAQTYQVSEVRFDRLEYVSDIEVLENKTISK